MCSNLEQRKNIIIIYDNINYSTKILNETSLLIYHRFSFMLCINGFLKKMMVEGKYIKRFIDLLHNVVSFTYVPKQDSAQNT